MPGMNGVEVSRHLRADPRHPAHPRGSHVRRDPPGLCGAAMAANAVLAKPFDLDDLLGVVARWATAS